MLVLRLKKLQIKLHQFLLSITRRKVKSYAATGLVAILCVLVWASVSRSILRISILTTFSKTRYSEFNIKTYAPGDIYDRTLKNRIYFHETTRRNALNGRQSCAIESAAMHNPEKPVHVFMLQTEEFDYSSPWLKVLSKYPNIEIVFVREEDYFKNTPLEDWYEKGEWRTSPYSYIHLSDYMRMLSEYKAGGLYLDLDIMTFKSYDLEAMGDFFVVQERSPCQISNAVFHLSSSNRFLEEIVALLAEIYDPFSWAGHGTDLINAMLHYYCNFTRRQYPAINTCTDIKIFPIEAFYALQPSQYDLMYERASNYSISLFNNSYAVHEWNSASKHEYIDSKSDQLYSILARMHCPLTLAEF